jgi:hypothetical protein
MPHGVVSEAVFQLVHAPAASAATRVTNDLDI